MSSLRSFEELDAWKIGTEIRRELMTVVSSFPASELYMLRSQIIRASRSVTNNIAEGYGRYTYKDNIKFLVNSRGSLHELLDHLIIAVDEKYLEEETFRLIKEKILRCISVINGLIRYLRNAKPDELTVKEPISSYSTEYPMVAEYISNPD